jgi:archaellum biogenesis ATPase FlaH
VLSRDLNDFYLLHIADGNNLLVIMKSEEAVNKLLNIQAVRVILGLSSLQTSSEFLRFIKSFCDQNDTIFKTDMNCLRNSQVVKIAYLCRVTMW